jgi:diguanylate cyclase (GGDEF)-like protein
MNFNPFADYVLLCGAISVALAYYGWRHRTAHGARPFSIFMLAMSVYIIGYSMELASPNLAGMLFWSKIEYIGILTFPTLYLVFTAEYTGQEKRLTRGNVFLLSAIPAVLMLIKIFDSSLHLIYTSVHVDAGGLIPLLTFTRGPLYLLISAYNIGLLTFGNYLLLRAWRSAAPLFRRQTAIMIAAALVIYFAYLWYLTGIPIVPGLPSLDINPFVYIFWSAAIGWAIFRHGLFDLAPIARDALIEGLGDGVVVLDGQGRVVDANPAARRLFEWSALPVGRSAGLSMYGWIRLADLPGVDRPVQTETRLERADGIQYYEVTVSPLGESGGRRLGYLIVAHDITARKAAERQLEELSLVDELTGLNNRRGFKLLADQFLQVARRMKWNALLLFLDLDGLKTINDTLGHAAGDRALIDTALLLKKSFRAADILARFGGDEFVILALESAENSERILLDRLEENIRLHNGGAGREYRLAWSVGLVRCASDDTGPIEAFLDRADQAMYAVKRAKKTAGGNAGV